MSEAQMKNSNQSPSPLIGIVTVLFNSETVLPGFFTSLASQEGIRYKLYVIDNSPKETGMVMSRNLASRYGIDATFQYNNANVGVAKGNNQGIQLAQADGCDLVLLANNDIEFGPSTILKLQEAMAQNGERVATPKIMYYAEPHKTWYAGGHINAWLARTFHHHMGQDDRGTQDTQRYTQYAPTCFMMLDITVFNDVGMMDESYFVYYDDTDYVWRMTRHHIRIRFVPSACVLHKVSTSTGGARSSFGIYYGNRNRIYFIRKNLSGTKKICAFLFVLATRIPKSATFNMELCSALWRGIKDGFFLPLNK